MKGLRFLIVSIVLVVLDVVVPYMVFASTGSFAASFLFWCLLTLAVIVYAGVYTRRWRDPS